MMALGLFRKCGMTRQFTPEGVSTPVTVLEASVPNRVSQLKDADRHGYTAVQLTAGKAHANRVTKPMAGHFAKASVEPGVLVEEFRVTPEQLAEFKLGENLSLEVFQPGLMIDVLGVSKGKGFAGAVKRHNFRTQDATHGNSLAHRAVGSTGQNQTPGRVRKGKKMAGQLGNAQCTVQNLQVVSVDLERGLLLVRGAVPGAPGGYVRVTPSVKKGAKS